MAGGRKGKTSLLLRGRHVAPLPQVCRRTARSLPALQASYQLEQSPHCHREFEDCHAQRITKQGGAEQMAQTEGRLKFDCFSNYTKYKWIQYSSKIQGLPGKIKKKNTHLFTV